MAIKVRPEVMDGESESGFEDTPEQQVTFLVVPMSTYRLCSERAKEDGCTAAQVFETALLQYLRLGKDKAEGSPTKTEPAEDPFNTEPDLVVRRRR